MEDPPVIEASRLPRPTKRLPAVKNSPYRLGIAAWLGVGFLVVAILAAAANLIVERGVLTTHTTIEKPVAPPHPVATLAPAPIFPAARESESPFKSISADVPLAAVREFERAVSNRIGNSNPASETQFQSERKTLEREAHIYLEYIATAANDTHLSNLSAAFKDFDNRGSEAIHSADAQRIVLTEYSLRFEAMNLRMKSALERSFKIFNRVIARQYLIQLGNDLDLIRVRFENLKGTGRYDKPTLDVLAASELAFVATLKANNLSLERSQGPEWVRGMSDDSTKIVSLRTTLLDLDNERQRTLDGFAQAHTKLINLAAMEIQIGRSKRRIPGTAAPLGAVATVDHSPAVEPSLGEQTQAQTLAPPNDPRVNTIAYISVAVLLSLLAIGAAIVMSVLAPVGRMLKATVKIANGDMGVRVPRGGIKELDTLAVAFNQMADQLSAAQDITRGFQQQLEAKINERTRQLQELAEHDPLTLLPNRRQLFALLGNALDEASRNSRLVGVFFLDLDNFKNINDSMGHAFGDRVLIAIARRLDDTSRRFGFAARLGGDEFTLIYTAAQSVEEIRTAGWDLVRAFQTPLLIDSRELVVGVSIGISVFPDHASEPDALLRAADAALFRAKALGRSQLNVFTPDLLEAASAKFATEQGLRRALERGEFELVFQPEINVETLEVGLVEALLRWRLPEGRLAPPSEFLAVAEESGLIIEISDWVLRSAIEAAADWHHGAWPQARVAINVSPRQLLDSRFVDRVWVLLQEFDLPARCIEIELTETVLQTGSATIEALRRLHSLGIDIALDDFGTGYSSLASLEQLPLSRIKLDRSLIASIDTSSRSAAIALAIIGLCRSLSLEVTAEGIERPEQLALLIQHRSMFLQGYLLSRPVLRNEIAPLLKTLHQDVQLLILSLPHTARERDWENNGLQVLDSWPIADTRKPYR